MNNFKTAIKLKEIQGIGPKISKQFGTANVITILDFLVKPSQFYARIIKQFASLDQVRSWQRMAVLLQVDGVNGQLAEALVKSGIHTIEQLGQKSITDLRKILSNARRKGIISETPEIDTLASIIRDANRLAFSRSILSQVVDESGDPIKGCVAQLGRLKAETNANGLFKIDYIRDEAKSLTVTTPGGEVHSVSHPPYMQYPEDTEFSQTNLSASSLHSFSSLDEYKGDVLPIRTNEEFIIKHEAVKSLRQNDILMVRSFYKSSPHVKLQSIFTATEQGKYIARTFKLPLSKVDQELTERQRYRWLHGRFVPVDSTAEAKTNQIRLRQAKPMRIPKKMTGKTLERILKKRLKEVTL